MAHTLPKLARTLQNDLTLGRLITGRKFEDRLVAPLVNWDAMLE
jgi:hypothetical protein